MEIYKNTIDYINILFIFDDIVSDLMKKMGHYEDLIKFFFNRRHILDNGMIHIIISTQRYVTIPPNIRQLCNMFFIFQSKNGDFINIRKEILDMKSYEKYYKNKNDFILYVCDRNEIYINFNLILK